MSGTPLLAQGELAPEPELAGVLGHTPARAGRTHQSCTAPSYSRHTPARAGRTGSSRSACRPVGAHPARAGGTASCPKQLSGSRAHPCSRRENFMPVMIAPPAFGTPLLAQGELGGERQRRHQRRHTPARAGRTLASSARSWARVAHPCSRTEDRLRLQEPPWWRGTPLLAQGEPDGGPGADRGNGHTPARAGRTTPRTRGEPWCWAHPCSRRETPRPMSQPLHQGAHPCSRREISQRRSRSAFPSGTPLLAQGNHAVRHQALPAVRHTPARAGKPPFAVPGDNSEGAHPCSRRETGRSMMQALQARGTPLLAQGNRN